VQAELIVKPDGAVLLSIPDANNVPRLYVVQAAGAAVFAVHLSSSLAAARRYTVAEPGLEGRPYWSCTCADYLYGSGRACKHCTAVMQFQPRLRELGFGPARKRLTLEEAEALLESLLDASNEFERCMADKSPGRADRLDKADEAQEAIYLDILARLTGEPAP
jgi:hypothetical protein